MVSSTAIGTFRTLSATLRHLTFFPSFFPLDLPLSPFPTSSTSAASSSRRQLRLSRLLCSDEWLHSTVFVKTPQKSIRDQFWNRLRCIQTNCLARLASSISPTSTLSPTSRTSAQEAARNHCKVDTTNFPFLPTCSPTPTSTFPLTRKRALSQLHLASTTNTRSTRIYSTRITSISSRNIYHVWCSK